MVLSFALSLIMLKIPSIIGLLGLGYTTIFSTRMFLYPSIEYHSLYVSILSFVSRSLSVFLRPVSVIQYCMLNQHRYYVRWDNVLCHWEGGIHVTCALSQQTGIILARVVPGGSAFSQTRLTLTFPATDVSAKAMYAKSMLIDWRPNI